MGPPGLQTGHTEARPQCRCAAAEWVQAAGRPSVVCTMWQCQDRVAPLRAPQDVAPARLAACTRSTMPAVTHALPQASSICRVNCRSCPATGAWAQRCAGSACRPASCQGAALVQQAARRAWRCIFTCFTSLPAAVWGGGHGVGPHQRLGRQHCAGRAARPRAHADGQQGSSTHSLPIQPHAEVVLPGHVQGALRPAREALAVSASTL